jgi:hypothetical protein
VLLIFFSAASPERSISGSLREGGRKAYCCVWRRSGRGPCSRSRGRRRASRRGSHCTGCRSTCRTSAAAGLAENGRVDHVKQKGKQVSVITRFSIPPHRNCRLILLTLKKKLQAHFINSKKETARSHNSCTISLTRKLSAKNRVREHEKEGRT